MTRRRLSMRFSIVAMCVGIVLSLFFALSIGRQFGFIGDNLIVAVAAGTLNVGANADLMVPGGWFLGTVDAHVSWLPENDRGVLVIPLWLPILLAIGMSWIAWHRSRKPNDDQCANCGYNLTGNLSGVCSECGMTV